MTLTSMVKSGITILIVVGLVLTSTIRETDAQQGKTLLDFTCAPVFDEPVEFDPWRGGTAEDIFFYTRCVVINRGSKKVFLTRVESYARYNGIDREGAPDAWGRVGSSEFAPEKEEVVYFYNIETKKLRPTVLPIGLEGEEPITFFTKTTFHIWEKIIQRLNSACPDRLTKQITLRDLFKDCMGGEIRFGRMIPDFRPNPKDVLHTVTTPVTVFTSAGLKFTAADTIYVFRPSGIGGRGGTTGGGPLPPK